MVNKKKINAANGKNNDLGYFNIITILIPPKALKIFIDILLSIFNQYGGNLSTLRACLIPFKA
jgi:hypothetical protein